MRGKEAKRLVFLATVVAVVFAAAPQAASAAPRPVSAVSLGDSYISGEAGRWQGNSINPIGSATAPTVPT